MHIFITDDDLARHSNDASYVAAKADEFIRGLQSELENVRAAADAASITAEQTCSLLEQKFLALSTEFSKLESQNAQLQSSLDDRLSELAQAQAQKHQLHLQSIGKDGEIERLTMEVSELHKSKRQLIELVEQKDLEISEKNATFNGYLDKIVNLTDRAANREARISELEAELARSQATCTRLLQEKELIERHNAWLNDELTAKVDTLMELRRRHADLEEDVSTRLADAERRFNESSSSSKRSMERVKELELKLTSVQEELCSSRDAAAANEERLSAELSTVNKLVELYKESSEEWSQKAGELEGVIKALETHLSQVENDYKERLEKEISARKQLEKEAGDLKDKLERCEADIESSRKTNELSLLPFNSYTTERWMDPLNNDDLADGNGMAVSKIPVGVSGTALAASLLRDGWSLAKMYAKYQEAVDAYRHEQLGRKESEAVLQRVLCELEEKAGVILDERVEYERMVESYSVINQKLQHSFSEQANLEKTIQELKADLRRHERGYSLAQKEIVDLQKQVTVLLKECRDIQLRCGSSGHDQVDDSKAIAPVGMDVESDPENAILERLTFKDINGLVEQNVQLRSLVRNLSDQIEDREMVFKEKIEMELKKHTDEAASKVAAVLQRAEEQGHMIESLHTSVAMYKRLYEEEQKLRSSYSRSSDAAPVEDDGRRNRLLLLEDSQEATKKAQEKAAERLRSLEEDLAKSKSDIILLRSERDKMALDAKFARERLDSFVKEFEHQRNEMNGVLSRNVEFSQLIVDHQRKLRESSENLVASEELSRKLNMEVSVLKLEKEILSNAEKRACDEVRSLSERVYRLQATLDTIQSAEEAREEARAAEKRKQEEYVKKIEREWTEAKKELQQERDNVRALTSDREQTLKNAMRQIDDMGKELANTLHAVSAAETRAAVAETKLSELEKKMKVSDAKAASMNDSGISSSISATEVVTDLLMAKDEIQKLKEEARASKEHMLQYKSIAQVNETALKQMEDAHENFKKESEKLKESLENELLSLRGRISELDSEFSKKSEEVASAAVGKAEAFASALAEITCLKEENCSKTSQIVVLESQISALKEDLEKEHERWRASQANYERQVILQSETIQELTKTSQALSLLQQEASDLRKLVDAQKSANDELKSKWEVEKSMIEESKNQAEKKYDELNEQNKLLHSRLEAIHIQLAEKDRNAAGISSGSNAPGLGSDAGLQNVVNYLRRSKEIAETEISLLKQEKLRLQSQLDGALKAAETAQASLHTERSNSRTLLFSEEEIKSLQLQVRELTLLRESNMQLREENKHNFEECQKLREVAQNTKAQSDKLESLLRERQIEVEACKKEIEMDKAEKDHLEKRMSELLERCRNIDVEDYNRMKDDLRQMEEKLREKDAEMEGIKNLVSEQQEKILKLEQDLTKSESELNQRERRISDILQTEASLRSELEKQKKLSVQWKKKFEILSKEKEEFSKEKQALIKQIEDLKQGKRLLGNVTGEQVLKEKEEKEHRIQILEKTVERLREELKREKEDLRTEKSKRQITEKAVLDSYKNVEQTKTKLEDKLELHKQVLKRISDELEKLKHAEGNLPEGTSVVQLLSGTILDDLGATYVSAIENFERVALSVSSELGAGVQSVENPLISDASATVTPGQAVPSQAPIVSSVAPHAHLPTKMAEEKERKAPVPKPNVETRKTGRKLVRPRLVRPEEPPSDVEMSEVDGSTSVAKLTPASESETQHNITLFSQPIARKRLASSSSDLNEQPLNQGETSSDVPPPVLKRPKGTDSVQEGSEGQAATPSETVVTLPVVEESAVADLSQGEEEAVAEKEEVETSGEKAEPPKESEQLDDTTQVEPENETNEVAEEILDKPSESGMEIYDGSKDQATAEDNQQLPGEFENEREEGELVAEIEDGADMSNMAGSPETGEVLPDTTPVASPARIDDEAMVPVGMESGEINSPEMITDEKNDEGDIVEEIGEGSDKSNEGGDQIAVETDQSPEAASVAGERTTATAITEMDASKQASSSGADAEEVRQVSPASNTSTVVNLAERARQRAMLRQGGSGAPAVLSPPGARGRGRVLRGRVARGARGGRGGRSGRGQTPGQQG
ncbi:nuclear-pore anchor [Populus alba x Populus x berolinensis]|uniref:Nuclear-pore anchor n=1 Tax=Populus alba x Populus x berolinensis TaxID=444605 RepID=A0AAD6ML93_9ROSI|nr:nuclear-pore anchor [Populus alba x Populus x berolinensis]